MKKNKGKLPKEFVCVKCDYKCGYPSEYIRHLGTVKHNKTECENRFKTNISGSRIITFGFEIRDPRVIPRGFPWDPG